MTSAASQARKTRPLAYQKEQQRSISSVKPEKA
nr:MAG TPA: hypothetical protein [Caudoviricetes sp.]